MKTLPNEVQKLFEYVSAGTSAFHVIDHSKKVLSEAGFTELKLKETWNLERGGRYFCVPFDTTLYAFTIGADFIGDDTVDLTAVSCGIHGHGVSVALEGGGQAELGSTLVLIIPGVLQAVAGCLDGHLGCFIVFHRYILRLGGDLQRGFRHGQGDGIGLHLVAVLVGDDAVDLAVCPCVIHCHAVRCGCYG